LQVVFEKKNKIAIVIYENKHKFFYLYEETSNPRYLIFNLNDYCYFYYDKQDNEIFGTYYQIFKDDGLFAKKSNFFIGFQKNMYNGEIFANIFSKDNKVLFNADFNFIYPEGFVNHKTNIVLATQKVDKNYTKYLFINVNTQKSLELKQNYMPNFVEEVRKIMATKISWIKFVKTYPEFFLNIKKEIS